jgi:tight adherence protein C
VDNIVLNEFALIGTFAGIVTGVLMMGLWLANWLRPVPDRRLSGDEPILATVSPFTASLARLLPAWRIDDEDLDRDLCGAGYYSTATRQRYLATRNGLLILVVVAAFAAVAQFGPGDERLTRTLAITGGVVAGLVWALPRIWVRTQARRRLKRIRHALPDALDLFNMCLAAGLPLREAVRFVAARLGRAHRDLAQELTIVERQSHLSTLDSAFEQFAGRLEQPETTYLANIVRQSVRLGVDIAGPLRDFADNLRTRRRYAAESLSGSASVKLLFPLAVCLLPSVFLLLWGPAALQLTDFMRQFRVPNTAARATPGSVTTDPSIDTPLPTP